MNKQKFLAWCYAELHKPGGQDSRQLTYIKTMRKIINHVEDGEFDE